MTKLFSTFEAMFNVAIDFCFVIPIIGKSRVNLAHAEVGMLKMDFFRTPTIGFLGGYQFHYFQGGSCKDGDTRIIQLYIFMFGGCEGHSALLVAHLAGLFTHPL